MRISLVAYLILTIIWIAMVLLVDPRGDFPLNDDWIYAGAAKLISETGQYAVPGPGSPNLIIQAYWGALQADIFGFSFETLRYANLMIGCAGVLGFYALMRDNEMSVEVSFLFALTLAFNPSYFVTSNSFMTDMPFVSISILAILCFLRGIRQESLFWLISGITLTLISIGIRQFGLCTLLTFSLLYSLRYKSIAKLILIGIVPLGVGIGLHLAYHDWLANTGREPEVVYLFDNVSLSTRFLITPIIIIYDSLIAIVLIGVLALPIIITTIEQELYDTNTIVRYRSIVLLAVFFLFSGFVLNDILPLSKLVMEHVVKYGSTPLTLTDVYTLKQNRPDLTSSLMAIATAIILLGIIGGANLCRQIILFSREVWINRNSFLFESRGAAKLFGVILASTYWGALLILLIQNGALFERYLILFIPCVALFAIDNKRATAIARGNNWSFWTSIGVLVLMATFTVANTHDYLSWNRVRWVALRNLLRYDDVTAKMVDGGYEFNGLYEYDPNYQVTAGRGWWWVVDDEYIIAFGPLSDYEIMQSYPVNNWLPLTPQKIYVLRRNRRGGPDERGD